MPRIACKYKGVNYYIGTRSIKIFKRIGTCNNFKDLDNNVISLELLHDKKTLVDKNLFFKKRLNEFRWTFSKTNGYVCNDDDNIRRYLHREILEFTEEDKEMGLLADHINNDRLDNRLSNLRKVTHQQNSQNQSIQKKKRRRQRLSNQYDSKYKGVCETSKKGHYRAYINHKDKQISLGVYARQEEAAYAYNLKAIEIFGKYALLNDVLPQKLTKLGVFQNKYRGIRTVKLSDGSNKYWVRVKRKGVEKNLGSYKTIEEAYKVRQNYLSQFN